MNINANIFTGSYSNYAAPAAVGLETVSAKSDLLTPIVEIAKSPALNVRTNPGASGVSADIQRALRMGATAGEQLGLESPTAGEQLGLESPTAGEQLGLETSDSGGAEGNSQGSAAVFSNLSANQNRDRNNVEMRQLEADQARIRQLAARDREVRNHEQAHSAIGGKYAGSPSYTTVRGPDGVTYAVGGEVSISAGGISGNPEASIRKARQVARAALAPADPSSADRQIAARANQIVLEAQVQIQQINRSEQTQEREAASEKRAEDNAEAEQSTAATVATTTATPVTEFSPFPEPDEAVAGSRADEEQQDKERQDRLNEANRRSFNVNQRLIDLGLSGDSVDIGAILSAVV